MNHFNPAVSKYFTPHAKRTAWRASYCRARTPGPGLLVTPISTHHKLMLRALSSLHSYDSLRTNGLKQGETVSTEVGEHPHFERVVVILRKPADSVIGHKSLCRETSD